MLIVCVCAPSSSIMRIAYKHTSKAGGTYLDRVLRDVFGQSYVAYGEGPADMNRSAELYLIGSVRNPCAWLVSMWGYSWRQSCKRMYAANVCAHRRRCGAQFCG